METFGWTLYRPRLSFFCFFCLFGSSSFFVLVKNHGKTKEKKQFLETLGWTLYLPRLLETSFLDSSSFFLFLVLVKNLGKTKTFFGDSWMDPLSLKTFRQLFFIFVFCCSKVFLFFLFWSLSAIQEKTHIFQLFGKGGGPAQTLRILFFFFFSKVICFLVRSTGFAGTNCHTLLAGPQAIYSSYKRFKRCYSTTPFGLPDSQGPIVTLDRKLFQLCGRL